MGVDGWIVEACRADVAAGVIGGGIEDIERKTNVGV